MKFYFATYFFLAFGMLQWFCGVLLFLNSDEESRLSAMILFSTGIACLALYLVVATKLKRVAIGKDRVAVITRKKTKHYEWPEIKSIKAVPYFNLYRLKVKGKKELIYFLPDKTLEPLFGLFGRQAELAEVLKKRK